MPPSYQPVHRENEGCLLFSITTTGAYLALIEREVGGQKEKSKEQKKRREDERKKERETEVGVENVTCPNHPKGICPAGLLSWSPDSQRGVPRQAIFPVLLAKGSQC